MLNFRRIGQKAKEILSRKEEARSVEKWSAYRMFVFFFSIKGQKQLWMFGYRSMVFVFGEVTGIKQKQLSLYEIWMRQNSPTKKDLKAFENAQLNWRNRPLISVVMPVYNPKIEHISEAVSSVKNQIYSHWELCITDDHSQGEEVEQFLSSLENAENIKVRRRNENGHIAAATNGAIGMANGDFIAFMDQDDLLAPEALYEVVKRINKNPKVELLYSDEDKVDTSGNYIHPNFKPEWCKDNLYSRNYIGHLVVVQKKLLHQVGNMHQGIDGAQDYDLLLRLTEKTNRIEHIAKILYHWRAHENSTSASNRTKNYAFIAQKEVLNRAFKRQNIAVNIESDEEKYPGVFHIRYPLEKPPKVTVIIPSHNQTDILETCLSSLFKKTEYPNYEVLLVSNNTNEDTFFDLVKKYQKSEPKRFRFVENNIPFNFSKLMNDAVKISNSPLILLLNNDTEILHADWMQRMAENAVRPEIGAVGAKLLYPNNTIQHAGVIIGLGGPAGHNFIGVDDQNGGYYYQIAASNNYSAVTAACLMVERKKYLQIDGFDEEQVIEFNDVDFCLRLRETGYRNLYLPKVKLYHHESLTRGHPHLNKKSYKQHLKDVKRFKDKWKSYIENDPCYNPNLSRIITTYEPRIDRIKIVE